MATDQPTSSQSTGGSDGKSKLSESDYLAQQAADAKAAISRTLTDIKRELAHSADPRLWMNTHPWATIGAAAVAGFVAAAVAVPSKEQQALKRLAELEKALNPHPYPPPAPGANGDAAASVHKGAKPGGSFLTALMGQVLHAVQPVLMSAITAGVTAKSVQPDEPTGGTEPGQQASAAGGSTARGADPSI